MAMVTAERIEETAALLERACLERGQWVSHDGRVYDDVAAEILGRSVGTLANWRANGGARVPFFRAGRRGRVTYRLRDLAEYIESTRDSFT
jgi:hypothetical protein